MSSTRLADEPSRPPARSPDLRVTVLPSPAAGSGDELGGDRGPSSRSAPRERDDWSVQGSQSARSLLLTVLGEYVLPRDGTVWTSTFLEALTRLGVEDTAARQALARAAKAGWLASERAGREARWHLTEQGRELLAAGSTRIYTFDPTRRDWDGKWLVLVISIPDERRADRHALRTRLAWAGFGSLGQGVWLSPDAGCLAVAESIFDGLERPSRLVSFVAEFGGLGDARTVVQDAWDLVELEARYRAFLAEFAPGSGTDASLAFRMNTRIVHEWRKFPRIDPGLPASLLPHGWPSPRALTQFQRLHAELAPAACAWFEDVERQGAERRARRQRGS